MILHAPESRCTQVNNDQPVASTKLVCKAQAGASARGARDHFLEGQQTQKSFERAARAQD